MLAARRFIALFAILGLISLGAVVLPIWAQSPYMEFHGVPPSGIGGTAFSAVRPNPGNAAIGCCASFFFPSSFSPMVPYPPIGTQNRSHHGHHHHNGDKTVIAEPVFVPYGVPYAVDAEDDGADSPDDGGPEVSEPAHGGQPYAGDPRGVKRHGIADGVLGPDGSDAAGATDGKSAGNVGSDGNAQNADAEAETPPAPPEPVVAQPTTVLVFKDGHRSEVGNYAIVGDSLFDFSGDRTRKILLADLDIPATIKLNEAAGVEFRLPPASSPN